MIGIGNDGRSGCLAREDDLPAILARACGKQRVNVHRAVSRGIAQRLHLLHGNLCAVRDGTCHRYAHAKTAKAEDEHPRHDKRLSTLL